MARPLPNEVSASVVTLAELELGVLVARDADARARRLATLTRVREQIAGLPADDRIASAYARLAATELASGRKPRVHDTWIAATALVHSAQVWTQDRLHDVYGGRRRACLTSCAAATSDHRSWHDPGIAAQDVVAAECADRVLAVEPDDQVGAVRAGQRLAPASVRARACARTKRSMRTGVRVDGPRHVAQSAYQELRRRIVDAKLARGTLLRPLAEESHRGATVAQIPREQVLQIIGMRIVETRGPAARSITTAL